MENTQPTPAGRKQNPLLLWTSIVTVGCAVTLIVMQQFKAAKPQLDIKNTGQTVVTVLHRGDSSVIQPGQTWHFRFNAGDTLTIHAGDSVSAPSRTVTLDRRDVGSDMPSRVPVEVRVEGVTNIVFEYSGDK